MNKKKLLLFFALLLSLAGQAQTATGPATFCVGTSATYMGTPGGGTWSSSSSAIATVSATSGIATGVSAGTVVLTYTLPTSAIATITVTVGSIPPPITGSTWVCIGMPAAVANASPGGTWSSSTPAVASVSPAGALTGYTPGTTTITYTLSSGCFTSTVITVAPTPTVTATPVNICVGATSTLMGSPAGGTWTTASPALSIGSGLVTGVTAGIGVVTYSQSGCTDTVMIGVLTSPGTIGGTAYVCMGTPATLTNSVSGGTWASGNPSVATIDGATGVVTGAALGTAMMTYTLTTGCYATRVATVNPVPVVSASVITPTCGNTYTLTATGAASYTWTSPAGLSCATCTSPTLSPTGPDTRTVTGWGLAGVTGCSATATVTLSGNRIHGHINFSATAPTSPVLKVWLIQYNPADSSITATDSVTTCMDGTSPYYSFDGKPAGNYLVKARLNGAVPGTSDYIPTYGASTANWYSAATITHAAATNTQDINMIYGTVPAGPGFISGYVYAGAGKGTASEIPVAGMVVYLRNAAGDVITYTYTDASGNYSFSSLAYGTYSIFPTEHSYYTTPSAPVTLSAATPSATGVGFRQYTTTGVILPWSLPVSVLTAAAQDGFGIYPNPASATVSIQTGEVVAGTAVMSFTDVTGRTVSMMNVDLNANGAAQADISGIGAGIYMVRINTAHFSYTTKLVVE